MIQKRNFMKFIVENIERIKNERIKKVIEELMKPEEQSPKKYHLDITTIQTIDDVKIILAGLDLAIYDNSPEFPLLKKYFPIEGEDKLL